jgi:hypothetical protein
MSYFNLGQVDIEALAKLYGGTPAPTNTRPPAVMPVSRPAGPRVWCSTTPAKLEYAGHTTAVA